MVAVAVLAQFASAAMPASAESTASLRQKAAAAKALGITQPRLNALLKGKIALFSLDALVNIASRAGLNVRLVVKKAA